MGIVESGFLVVLDLCWGLDPPDGPDSWEDAQPVGRDYKQEYGGHQGEEPASVLGPRHTFGQAEEELDDDFQEALKSGWNLTRAAGAEEGDQWLT